MITNQPITMRYIIALMLNDSQITKSSKEYSSQHKALKNKTNNLIIAIYIWSTHWKIVKVKIKKAWLIATRAQHLIKLPYDSLNTQTQVSKKYKKYSL